jgi:hypothetical protein
MEKGIETVRDYGLLNVQKLADELKMNKENCEIDFCKRINSLPNGIRNISRRQNTYTL